MHRLLLIAALAASSPAIADTPEPMPDLRAGREVRPRDSVWQLSGEVPLSAVEALARQQIPANQRWRAPAYTHPINGGAGSLDGISIGYDIVSGVASVRAGGRGQIVTVIPVTYSIWARYQPVAHGPSFDASCQRRAASLVLTTTLSVRRSRLAPSTRASVAARSRCVITRLNIDVTDLLSSLIGSQLRRVTAEIDREVAGSLELGGAAALAWRRLLSPQKLDGGWLDLNPASLQIPPITADGGSLQATVQVIAKSRVSLGGERPPVRSEPVPSIDSHSSPPSISVLVDVSVSHRSLDRWATRAARRIKSAPVTAVAVRPRGREVAVGADVRGAGRVWLTGALGADETAGQITISGLRPTAASRARLARARVSPSALAGDLERALGAVAVAELADLRPRIQDALTESLDSAVPLLSGAAAVDRVRFASAASGPNSVTIYLRAEGRSIAGRGCAIRARGRVVERDIACTRKAARAHCAGDRSCQYAPDGKTWLPAGGS